MVSTKLVVTMNYGVCCIANTGFRVVYSDDGELVLPIGFHHIGVPDDVTATPIDGTWWEISDIDGKQTINGHILSGCNGCAWEDI